MGQPKDLFPYGEQQTSTDFRAEKVDLAAQMLLRSWGVEPARPWEQIQVSATLGEKGLPQGLFPSHRLGTPHRTSFLPFLPEVQKNFHVSPCDPPHL